MKLLRGFRTVFTRRPRTPKPASPLDRVLKGDPDTPIPADLDSVLQNLRHVFGEKTTDMVIRRFCLGNRSRQRVGICYLQHQSDTRVVEELILEPLMLWSGEVDVRMPPRGTRAFLEAVLERLLPMGYAQIVNSQDEAVDGILQGMIALFFNGNPHALLLEAQKVRTRQIDEPPGEFVVRGPREGFNESLSDSISLLRRRIKTANLRIERLRIGRISKTDVAIFYINDLTNEALVSEARRRLAELDIDIIVGAGQLEQFIEDSPFSPFPSHGFTERPDMVQRWLSQGRVAIMMDGSPQAIVAPFVFADNFHTAEDIVIRGPFAYAIRLVRIVGALIALNLPATYIAITTYHHELIPTPLAMSVAAAREGVPFPAIVEALAMEIVIEVIREGSTRLPGPLGQTVGIVGALILGDTAVRAGIVSPLLVIVVALTTLSNFIIPQYTAALGVRVARFVMMAFAAVLGLPGMTAGLIALSIHLVGKSSLGVPYMTPWAPFRAGTFLDTILRKPVWAMVKRPRWLRPQDSVRQGEIYLRDWNAPSQRRQERMLKRRRRPRGDTS